MNNKLWDLLLIMISTVWWSALTADEHGLGWGLLGGVGAFIGTTLWLFLVDALFSELRKRKAK